MDTVCHSCDKALPGLCLSGVVSLMLLAWKYDLSNLSSHYSACLLVLVGSGGNGPSLL